MDKGWRRATDARTQRRTAVTAGPAGAGCSPPVEMVLKGGGAFQKGFSLSLTTVGRPRLGHRSWCEQKRVPASRAPCLPYPFFLIQILPDLSLYSARK